MKKYILLHLGLGLVSIVFILNSCVKGKGDVTSRTFYVDYFSGVSNTIDADVHLLPALEPSVEIVAQENIINNISLRVTDNVLIIKFKKKASNYKPININVYMTTLESIFSSSSGDITAGIFNCDAVTINMSGSGNVDAWLYSSSDTYIRISGSGDLSLQGSSYRQDISLSGSGNLHAFDFTTLYSEARITGSGSAELKADSTLNATLTASGDLYYKGHPVITSTITGSGSIHDAN